MNDKLLARTIRRATIADARQIAEVHVRSWQWAYRGIFPRDYLDGLSPDRRAEAHATRLGTETEGRTWVVEYDGRTIGFATSGPSRDPDAAPTTAEIGAIYLEEEFAGTGIGHALLSHTLDDLWRRGYKQATLWVVESNDRARQFYERNGWASDGETKVEEWAGAVLPQLRYRRLPSHASK